jgi:hypothetical protein
MTTIYAHKTTIYPSIATKGIYAYIYALLYVYIYALLYLYITLLLLKVSIIQIQSKLPLLLRSAPSRGQVKNEHGPYF